MRGFKLLLCCLAFLTAAGCGATVGDACTVPADCGGQLCINRDHTPGGYCSRQCVLGADETCPPGTTCIKDGAGKELPACFRLCASARDCRSGYTCRSVKDNPRPVCVGPIGP